ncbi:MAG: hypothetical protein SGJ01_02345 [Gemmatimonadota bacterium]|nr:hypothetical protein [Gemmatimonadota bacterium]
MRPRISHLLPLLAGCAPREEAIGPADFQMSGLWRQSGDLRDTVNAQSHIHLGTFTLWQTDASFAGTGQQGGGCGDEILGRTYEGPLADPAPFPVTSGLVNARLVSFKTDICDYQGSFEDGNPNRITGTAHCAYTRNGVDDSFAGQWQADRLP